jgi:large subunit ribosomal protein L3
MLNSPNLIQKNNIIHSQNQLMIFPQMNFTLAWGRNKSKDRVRWKEFGSLEQEVNTKFDVDHTPSKERNSKRCGAIGYKVGMTSLWDKWGVTIPCTVIQIDRCQVVQISEDINDKGTNVIQVGAGEGNPRNMKNSQVGHFIKAGVPIKKHTAGFQVSKENFLPIGYMIGPSHFKIGNFVDVQGNSKGKGFQGTIKRWNFGHQFFTHGNSKAHRKPGALQGCEEPGKVFKGKKMAGKMGNSPATHFSAKVIRVDNERSLIYVKGPVPGSIGGMVTLRDSLKKYDKQLKEVNAITTGIDTWEGDVDDPFEVYEHENVGVAGPDGEEE